MTVYASKPEINVREKLKELDYGHVPYEKMPAGSVIQVKYVSRTSDVSTSTTSGWTTIDSMEFTPMFSNSILELSVDYSMGTQSGVNARFRFSDDDGEIERTGIYNGDDGATEDAWPARNNWTHFYKPNSNATKTYYFQGMKTGGSGVIWYHTYGASTTSFFIIREIKQ